MDLRVRLLELVEQDHRVRHVSEDRRELAVGIGAYVALRVGRRGPEVRAWRRVEALALCSAALNNQTNGRASRVTPISSLRNTGAGRAPGPTHGACGAGCGAP